MLVRVFGFILLACLIFPQGKNISIQHLSVEDGLSQSSVYSIFQDHFGFLWFGTGDGLNRYDGYEFKVYRHNPKNIFSLSGNTIRSIGEDLEGNIWVGTDNGLNKFDPKTNKFYNAFNSPENNVFKLKVGYNIDNLISDKDNVLWFNYQNFVFSYDQRRNKVQEYKLLDSWTLWLSDLFIDKENNVWASLQNKLYRYDRKLDKFILFTPLSKINMENINFIFEDEQGNLNLINSAKSIIKIDKSKKYISEISLTFADRKISGSDVVSDFCNWKHNHSILAVNEKGLFDLDNASGKIIPLNIDQDKINSINLKSIYCLYKDRSDIFWIGTDEGIVKVNLTPPKFKPYKLKYSGKDLVRGNFIKSLFKDSKGNLWIGTYEYGLHKINKSSVEKTFTSRNTPEFKTNSFYSIYEDFSGTLWFGSNDYLYKKDRDKDSFEAFKIDGNVNSISEYPKGKLWLGTSSGLCFFKAAGNNNATGAGEKKVSRNNFGNTILTMYNDHNGNLLLGTYGTGLIVYNIASDKMVRYENKQSFSNEISDNKVISISNDPLDKNVYWIGTENGLNKFDIIHSTFEGYFENNGLPNDYIYGILSDDKDNLWISTNKGISKLNCETMKFKNYSVDDGLQSNEYNSGAYYKDAKGYLYFGGINGYNIFYPDSVFDNQHQPQVILTGIKKFDENFNLGKDASEVKEINLKYNESTITFEFSALEFTNPSKNKYSVKLDGLDPGWIYLGTKRQARYTNLNPGKYVFMVKASNSDGVWNPVPLKVTVNIIPPIWQEAWFRITGSVLLLILLISFVRYLEKRKYKRAMQMLQQQTALSKERIRISNDMHDDVGSVLTKMSLLLSSLQNRKIESKEEKVLVKKITDSNNEVIQKLDEIVWAVNPKNDNLKNLSEYISEYVEDLFEPTDISCRFDFPPEINALPLSSETRHNIFLAMKEVLNNIIKHSGANKVLIKLEVKEDYFIWSIHDNGKGFDFKSVKASGNGLSSMKERIEKIGGRFLIESILSEGTKIFISVPYKDLKL